MESKVNPLLAGCMHSRDVALSESSTVPVLTESARGFAGGVEAGNDLAGEVEDLACGVDAQAGPGVVEHRRRPGGIEGRLLDLELGCRFAEVGVATRVDKAVVPRHRLDQVAWRHGNPLIRHDDHRRELLQRVCLEEESVRIDEGWRHIPVPAGPGGFIVYGPDRATAVVAVADSSHGGVDPVLRVVCDVLGVQVAALDVRVDRAGAVGPELASRFVVEPLPDHVYMDNVLEVVDA